jgi:hypothetical protein
MAISELRASDSMANPNRYGGPASKPHNHGQRRRSEADQERKARLHGKLMNWFMQERDKQAENRYQMAVDEDFYDGLQWSDEDAQTLMERGQAPLVFNQVKPTINWMLGTERRSRIEGKVLPREERDEQSAEVKGKLIKYLSDVNRTQFKRSAAWKSCIVAGLGWLEDAINPDPTAELLGTNVVDWKQVYHDSNGKSLDINEDGRYLFRWSHLDLDVAEALLPDSASLIRSAAVDENTLGLDEDDAWYLGGRTNSADSGDYARATRRGMGGGFVNSGRERVKIIEAWYKMPVACQVCRTDDPQWRHLHGEEWDRSNPAMVEAYQDGYLSVVRHVKMEMRCALMTESHLLWDGPSPYKHNRFPLTPVWCYRRHRDGLPYGVIRDIRDAQIDYNKRASKALYILSTVRVVMDDGAVEDIDELRAEIARPDAIITKKKNSELRIEQDKQLAEEHIKLMMFDGQMIRDVGGVTDQNLGNAEGAMSGKAIGKLQDQGTIVTAPLFDNLRLALQLQSELQLSLMEQYYSAAKVVRIVGENRPIEWLAINQYDETEGAYLNDITRSKADYIIGEQDFKESVRQAMFESMMELISKLPPDVGLALLDMVIDFADVPNKDELVARVRKLNGQSDPSRKPTPEEEAAKTASEARQQEAQQIQIDTAKAQLAKLQAEADATISKAKESEARINDIVAAAVQKGVTAAYEALQAAQIVATVPNVTPVADAILAGAGYQDQGGQDPNLPAPTGELPAMTPRSDHGDYIGAAAGGPMPELQQADGAQAGIETPSGADGVI